MRRHHDYFFVACLMAGVIPLASSAIAEDSPAPAATSPTTKELAPVPPGQLWKQRHEEMLQVLRAGKWEQALEVYGRSDSLLEEDLFATFRWNKFRTDEQAKEETRLRLQAELVEFYFRYVDLPTLGILPRLARHEEMLAAYRDGELRLPLREKRLDTSGIELLTAILEADDKQNKDAAFADVAQRSKKTLKANPASAPATLAFLALEDFPVRWSHNLGLDERRRLLSSEFGRICFVRGIARQRFWQKETSKSFGDDWERLPTDEERARFLWRWAEEESQQAKRLHHLILERFPSTRSAADSRAQTMFITSILEGIPAAETFYEEQHQLGEAHRRGLDLGLLKTAQAQIERSRNLDKSEELLLKILSEYPDSPEVCAAMVSLADIHAKREEVDGEVKWLSKCVQHRLPTPEAVQDGISITEPAAIAIVRLAKLQEKRGDWAEAEKTWDLWRVENGCGSWVILPHVTRAQHQLRCLCFQDKHSDAAKLAWAELEDHPVMAWSLYVLYRDADQLPQLKAAYEEVVPPAARLVGGRAALKEILATGKQPARLDELDFEYDWPKPKKDSLPDLGAKE